MSHVCNVAEPAQKENGLDSLVDTISIEKVAYTMCIFSAQAYCGQRKMVRYLTLGNVGTIE